MRKIEEIRLRRTQRQAMIKKAAQVKPINVEAEWEREYQAFMKEQRDAKMKRISAQNKNDTNDKITNN